MALTPGKEDRMLRNYTTFEYWSSNNNKWTQLLPWLAQQAINFCKIKSVVFNYHYSGDQVASSLRSMAVLSIRAQERRSREKNKELLPPQSPRGLSALARLYYLARPTKTAMLRRLSSLLLVVHINLVKMHNCECSALLVLRRKVEFWQPQRDCPVVLLVTFCHWPRVSEVCSIKHDELPRHQFDISKNMILGIFIFRNKTLYRCLTKFPFS